MFDVRVPIETLAQQILDAHVSGPEPEPEVIAVCCRRYGDECCNQPVPEQQQPYPPQCMGCGDYWPCAQQVAAEAIVVAAREAKTRDEKIRERLESVRDYLDCECDAPCVWGSCHYCDNCAVRWDMEAALGLLGVAADESETT